MIILGQALLAWGTPDFEAALKHEIASNKDQLPLQQGLSTGNYVTADPISVTIIGVAEQAAVIRVRAGIFFRSVISGCSCENDPTPISEINEYCVVQLDIDKATAATAVTLIPE
jgi:hypothetical protein